MGSSLPLHLDHSGSKNTFGPAPPSLYFAELLSHISSISLLIKTPANSQFIPARLEFPYEGSSYVTLVYISGAKTQISLPVPFTPSLALTRQSLTQEVLRDPCNIRVSIKAEDQRLRIQPHETAGARKTGKLFAHTDKEEYVPLNAKTMGSMKSGDLKCAQCGAVVVRNATQSLHWNPLPSETWAEMMDFWHCHKPSEPKAGAAHDQFNKSYTVSKFVPTKETAFVGLTYFLIDSTSLGNTQTIDSSLNCTSCKTNLGVQDSPTSFKIFKWNVNLSETSPVSPFYYVSAEINELIAAHGVYTFALSTDNKTDAKLVLWVVNSNIHYTCTGSNSRKAFRVLYNSDKPEIPNLIKERGNDAVEQITVPDFVLESLESHLKSGNNLLQDSTQSNKWKVSVLDKYSSL